MEVMLTSTKTTLRLGIDEFDLSHVPDKEDFVRALESVSLYRSRDPNYNAIACLISRREGKRYSNILQSECHGFLGRQGLNNGVTLIASFVRKPSYIADRHHNWEGTSLEEVKEIHAAYYRWLLNDSPWSDVFIIKELKDGMPYVFLRTDVASNYLMSAIIASRSPWEYPTKIITWHRLVTKYGVNPNYAYLSVTPLGMSGKSYIFAPCEAEHWPLNGAMGIDFIKNFTNGVSEKKNLTEIYRKDSNYRGYSQTGDPIKVFTVFGRERSETDKLWAKFSYELSKNPCGISRTLLFSNKPVTHRATINNKTKHFLSKKVETLDEICETIIKVSDKDLLYA